MNKLERWVLHFSKKKEKMSKKGSSAGGLKLMTGGLLSGPLGVSIDHVSSIGPCLSSTSTLASDPNISIKPNPFFEKKNRTMNANK